MPRYRMVAFSRPAEGREAEYNDWYQNVHLAEVLALPGFSSAQRFRLARNVGGRDAAQYLAVYEIDTNDIDLTLDSLTGAATGGKLTMSDAMSNDPQHRFAAIYEEFGAVVSKE